LPAFKDNKLPTDAAASARLKQKIESLALLPPQKSSQSSATTLNGKTFTASSNVLHLQSMSFDFSNDVCKVKFQTDTASYQIAFGDGRWQPAETNMPEPALTAGLIENNRLIYPAKIVAAYTWKDANTLQLVLRYIESPHTATFICSFHDDKLTMEASKSFDYGRNKMVVEAVAK